MPGSGDALPPANTMKILVIDDSERHQDAARSQLADHDVTIAEGYIEAAKLLGNESMTSARQSDHGFDVVLTDMKLPMSDVNLTPEAFNPGELVSYGYVLALVAAKGGAEYVGVVTDTNHHDGAMSASLDLIDPRTKTRTWEGEPNLSINGATTLFVHAPLSRNEDDDLVKDWAKVLGWLVHGDNSHAE